uniref:Retrotransposon gag domain-containing protein n=1 Tax=Glossina palpalis gambiensis TaxID=67801 RepID=A0A1B0B4L9_9MUSC
MGDSSPLINQKWRLNYNGTCDPMQFIEKVEHLSEAYGIDRNGLPKDKENKNRRWPKWETFKKDFLRFFLPSRYSQNLEDEIRKTVQKVREPFIDFVLAARAPMRNAGYTEQQKWKGIHNNASPEKDFRSVDELVEKARDLESIPVGNMQLDREQPRNQFRAPQREQQRMVERGRQPKRRQGEKYVGIADIGVEIAKFHNNILLELRKTWHYNEKLLSV